MFLLHASRTCGTLVALLVGILILSAALPGAVTSRAQKIQDLPPPRCLKFGECDLITCNPNGSSTFTFAVTNLSTFAASSAHFNSITPSSVTISPNPYLLTPPLPPHATRQITVTIGAGLPNGTTVCFTLDLIGKKDSSHCSSAKKCITLGACGPVQPPCANGVCCGGAPHITTDPKFAPFIGKRLAVTTSRATIPTNTNFPAIQSEAVVRIIDLTESSSFVPNVNIVPPMYYGPPGNEWTQQRLGTVFGIELDRSGNIFVTATSAYNGDFYPASGTPGTIWRLDAATGLPSVYAQLPNFQDPTLVSQGYPNEAYPALGDIAYDCRFDQFFVTNLEDGKISRLKSGNISTNLTGSVASIFDPFLPDNNTHGFAPLGERIVADKVHNNRVYYSRWREDCGNPSATDSNEIWSVGLNTSTGDFVPSDNRLELQLPSLVGQNFSNPVFDISFSRDGNMLLGERTMRCDPFLDPAMPQAQCISSSLTPYAAATLAAAHASRVLEYICDASTGSWTLSSPFIDSSGISLPYRFNVGNLLNSSAQCPLPQTGWPANAAGGVAYAYPIGNKYTVWATGDSLLPYTPQATARVPYGLQGFLPGGGGMSGINGLTTAIAIDLNGIMPLFPNQFSDKAQIGDVEIVCPPSNIERSQPRKPKR